MAMSECVLCVRMSVRHGPTLTGSMRATDRTICAPLREWFNDLLTITQRAALSDGSPPPSLFIRRPDVSGSILACQWRRTALQVRASAADL